MTNKLFLDLETTGLNPAREEVLEIGLVICDENYSIIDMYSSIVLSAQAQFRISNGLVDDFIKKMHGPVDEGGSGLLERIGGLDGRARERVRPERVEADVLSWLADHEVGRWPTYGSSVAFDRKFLEQVMPTLQEKLHYRIVDSSSDMERLKADAPELWAKIDNDPDKRAPFGNHSVIADIMYSIDVERRINKWVTQPALSFLAATERLQAELDQAFTAQEGMDYDSDAS